MDDEKKILVRHAGTSSLSHQQLEAIKHLQIDPAQFPLIQEALESKNTIICQDARSDQRVNHDDPPADGYPLDAGGAHPLERAGAGDGFELYPGGEVRHHPGGRGAGQRGGEFGGPGSGECPVYGETRQRLAESQGVQRVTTSLLRKNNLQEVLEIICNEALNLTDATGSAVLLLNENDLLQVTSAVGEILSLLGPSAHRRLAGRAGRPVGRTGDFQ